LCFGFGPVQAQQFFGHLYKEASSLGFREFSCLVKNYRVLHRVSSLWGNGAAMLSNKDCCEGTCVIKDYQAVVWGVVIFITLLARFIPLLQVTFFVLLEDFYLVDSLWKIGTKLIGSPAWSLSHFGLKKLPKHLEQEIPARVCSPYKFSDFFCKSDWAQI
jgi:hypothetical protein